MVETKKEECGNLELQERDYEVLRMAHEQGYVALNQIKLAFWPENSTGAYAYGHRIWRLTSEGYLRWAYSHRFKLKIYLLTEKGLEALKEKGMDSGLEVFKLSDSYEVALAHYLNVTNIRIAFRRLGFNDWVSERRLREGKNLYLVPDGVIEHNGHQIAIELEMTQKQKKRYLKRFEYYRKHPDYLTVFIVLYEKKFEWLIESGYDPAQVWFITYKEMLDETRTPVFRNKTGEFPLSHISGS